RPDEIWFMEKDKFGCSDMYPLSEFKEHKTKDIRKGYLNGRYGAIPFLSPLKNLNWNDYATT
ncbi:MAG: AAA family ATPase, partial [Saprospiraceae bacterium]